jgi:polar amino acid transport system substrate-binding protein
MRGFSKHLVWALMIALMIGALGLVGCGGTDDATGTDDGGSAETPAASDGALEAVQERGTLIIGVAPFYAPFESTNEATKELEGFDIDMMTEMASRMGVEVEFITSEWQGLLGGLEKGDFDAIVSAMSKKEAAEGNVEFSEVYYELPEIMLVLKGNPAEIETKEDLAGKRVGVQLGSHTEPLAEEIAEEVELGDLARYKLTQDAMNDLKAKRIDVVLAGLAFAIEQNAADPSYEIAGEPLSTDGLVGVFKNGSTSLADEFNRILAEMRADGTYDALVEKWLTVN